MSLFATQEQVNTLRKRAASFAAGRYPGADPLIKPLLDEMAKLENIACVWSCEGHFDPSKKGRGQLSDFYLMMAVTAEGFETLTRLYEILRARLMTTQVASHAHTQAYRAAHPDEQDYVDQTPRSNVHQLSMGFTSRTWPTKPEPGASLNYYNAVILNGQTGYDETKHVFFEHLMAAVKELLASYED